MAEDSTETDQEDALLAVESEVQQQVSKLTVVTSAAETEVDIGEPVQGAVSVRDFEDETQKSLVKDPVQGEDEIKIVVDENEQNPTEVEQVEGSLEVGSGVDNNGVVDEISKLEDQDQEEVQTTTEELESIEQDTSELRPLSPRIVKSIAPQEDLDSGWFQAVDPSGITDQQYVFKTYSQPQIVITSEDGDTEFEKDDETCQWNKEDLLIKLHKVLAKQDSLHWTSLKLQNKIANYYKKTKLDEKHDQERKIPVTEEKYLKCLRELRNVRDTVEKTILSRRAIADAIKQKCQEKKDEVEIERKRFLELKQSVAQNALFSHTRKPLPTEEIEQYLTAISNKEVEISRIRLGIIKLKNNMEKIKTILKSKEELGNGLRLQDFEQLKIENQTYNEKIEERNEDMLKLKRKISSTVNMLTHCKEKLNYVQNETLEQVAMLKEVEASLAKSRDILARSKHQRDALRAEQSKLNLDSGLLGNTSLLKDFEMQKQRVMDLNNKLQQLKTRHELLALRSKELKEKIALAQQNSGS